MVDIGNLLATRSLNCALMPSMKLYCAPMPSMKLCKIERIVVVEAFRHCEEPREMNRHVALPGPPRRQPVPALRQVPTWAIGSSQKRRRKGTTMVGSVIHSFDPEAVNFIQTDEGTFARTWPLPRGGGAAFQFNVVPVAYFLFARRISNGRF
jgi:hypothetical protein